MRCPYSNICSDVDTKCGTCMNNEKRSYYVEYHEYPEEKCTDVPDEIGDDLRFTSSCGNTTRVKGMQIFGTRLSL